MLSFKKFLEERKISPEKLAARVAQIHGKNTDYEGWEAPIKNKHIPLKDFDDDSTFDATMKSLDLGKKHGHDNFLNNMHVNKTMNIKDLKSSQPFVRTDNVDQLKNKINNKNDKIRVATHNGDHYIMDGHHAVIAARMRGEKTVNVSYVNMDKH